ncbi:MAG: antitoxin Xre/MbcA/ParS toxin-binding domain-containing protein [Capsulimonadaceae bacterium]
MAKKLYISNLIPAATDQALHDVFAEVGPVDNAQVITDRATGESRGYGIVEMATEEAAGQALYALTNRKDMQAKLVSESRALYAYAIPEPAMTLGVQRRLQAISDVEASLRPFLDQAEVGELERLAAHAKVAYTPRSTPKDQEDLVEALVEGRTYTRDRHVLLELDNQLRSFHDRREVLRDSVTSTEVARLLGTSRQTPHDRVNSGQLLAIPENGRLLFPLWQFDPSGPHGVLKGLPEVLKALAVSPLSKARWLTRPNPAFDGRSPLEILREGDTRRVVEAARGVEVC